jgi:ribose/xylose/arabinose/galactoside ABC-type transport system permease subunit
MKKILLRVLLGLFLLLLCFGVTATNERADPTNFQALWESVRLPLGILVVALAALVLLLARSSQKPSS